MKNRRNRIIAIAILALLLVAAVAAGVTLRDRVAAEPPAAASAAPKETRTPAPETEPEETALPEESDAPEETDEPEESASPAPDEKPEETPAPTPTPTPAAQTVTVSIVCYNALQSAALPDGVRAVLPAGGVLLQRTVTLEQGDTVWSVTQRACREAGMSIESTYAAAQSAVYVEGIGQLYEFDCGEGSGWIYKVNGTAPGRGCDGVTLNPGDNLVWAYTCNYGNDV